ncbi:hypothetical protein FF38_06102 [Lucilia cuprina]|uniref:DUF4806 domain-containing protein n=1 Tax=Lucilia cuprina TaxID=7375 RepID=A0A0L0CI12_LUCCU|nr:hypothetical protein FF38_06102 [Lucilia cuprina]
MITQFPVEPMHMPSSVSFNVHSLLHLVECVEEFSDLNKKNKSIQQKADKDLTAQTKDSLIEILSKYADIYNFLQQQSENNKNILAGIENLKDTIVNQNNILTNVLSNQIVALNSSFKSHFEHPKYTTLFPLSSEKDLNDFENMINDDNKSEIVSSIKRVLGNKNSQKEICNIISNKMLLEYNMRGIQGKKRLMDYKAIMNWQDHQIYFSLKRIFMDITRRRTHLYIPSIINRDANWGRFLQIPLRTTKCTTILGSRRCASPNCLVTKETPRFQ